MAREGDPRVVLRVHPEAYEALAAAAASVGVDPGGLARVCVEHFAVEAARMVREGRVRARRAAVARADAAVERVRAVERAASDPASAVPASAVPASGAARADAFRLMAQRRSSR